MGSRRSGCHGGCFDFTLVVMVRLRRRSVPELLIPEVGKALGGPDSDGAVLVKLEL